MATPELNSTRDTIGELLKRQGGGLFLEDQGSLDTDFQTWLTAASVPFDFKPLSISIYDSSQNVSVVTLILMINPKDINIGQMYVANNSYSRVGWITTIWGRQQMTISFSGSSPGFYFMNSDGSGGLTNFNRKASAGFSNLMSLVGLFKNNAYYFLNSNNATIFKDGTSRVINVMDSIRIDYDGSVYLGSFSTFSMTDTAAMPFRIEYNMEFVVSSLGVDLEPIGGHIKKGNNYQADDVTVAVQGANVSLNKVFQLDENELNTYYQVDQVSDDLDSQITFGSESIPGITETTIVGGVTKIRKVNVSEFFTNNPTVYSALADQSSKLGVPIDGLAAEITFESGGSWSATKKNPSKGSTATGLFQVTNIAAEAMAPLLVKQGIIQNKSQCQTSAQWANIFDTPEKQIGQLSTYYQSSYVTGTKTVYQAIQDAPTAEEKYNAALIGILYPSYVGKDLDTPFPAKVQNANPGIRTPRDYIRKVTQIRNGMTNINQNKVSMVETPQESKKSIGATRSF